MAAILGCHNSVLNQICVSRDEATRTPDPYVPNVVRYQLRYIPIKSDEKAQKRKLRLPRYCNFFKYVQKKGYFFRMGPILAQFPFPARAIMSYLYCLRN